MQTGGVNEECFANFSHSAKKKEKKIRSLHDFSLRPEVETSPVQM